MVFPWFSHGFPMVFPWFSHGFLSWGMVFPVTWKIHCRFQESPVELVASPGLDLDQVNESSVGGTTPPLMRAKRRRLERRNWGIHGHPARYNIYIYICMYSVSIHYNIYIYIYNIYIYKIILKEIEYG